MAKQLTLELPEPLFERLEGVARVAGQSPEEWLIHRIEAAVPSKAAREEALSRLLRHAGTSNGGTHARTDNDEIDRDLAREAESKEGTSP